MTDRFSTTKEANVLVLEFEIMIGEREDKQAKRPEQKYGIKGFSFRKSGQIDLNRSFTQVFDSSR